MDRLRCCVCWGLGALIAMSVGCADGAPRGDGRELDLEAWFRLMREKMVKIQIEGRGVKDQRVLEVMRRIPRHEFVPSHSQSRAYDDGAMPIGEGQTISQPYIVAVMTELLRLDGDERVLEIGTGSGYQAAVLAELVDHVYTIEIVAALAKEAHDRLERLGYTNISTRLGDGYRGWPEEAPFDAVIVTAAPDHIPQPLVDQLKLGGRMVIPVGRYAQDLMLLVKEENMAMK